MQYKVIPLPESIMVKKREGLDKAIAEYSNIINNEATYGWRYHSTELLPVTTKRGLVFKKYDQATHTVLIFVKE